MKRYEGLFILDTAGKEEGLKDVIDKIQAEITTAGGKIETVQKMEKKSFSRVADTKHSGGFYVNVIFQSPEAAIAPLRGKFAMNDDVFRVLFTVAPQKPASAPAPLPTA